MKTIALLVGVASGAQVKLHNRKSMADVAQDVAAVLKSMAPGDVAKQDAAATARKNDVTAFSEATLREAAIVTAEIKKEHAADVATLAQELKAITDVINHFKGEGARITRMFRTKELLLKNQHLTCRRVQEGNCTNEKYTNAQLLVHEINMSEWEETIQTEESGIKNHMCVEKDVNTWIVETVIELTGKLTIFEHYETTFYSYREVFYSLVEATRQWRPWPAWQHGNETETNVTRAQCNGVQLELEFAACQRLNEVLKVNWDFLKKYKHLVGIYGKAVEIILEKAKNRKAEWIGVKTVECLLNRIHDHETSNEPCDEDFQDNTTDTEIDSCHEDSYITVHLDINPEPIPDRPGLYCIDDHPCTAGWMSGKYAFGYHEGEDDLCRDLQPCGACDVSWALGGNPDARNEVMSEVAKGCTPLPGPDATTAAPTTSPTTTAPTTTTTTAEPADDVDVVPPDDDVVDDACKNGTILQFSSQNLVHNNLGGMGPDGGAEFIQWNNVATLNDRQVNLQVSADNDNYKNLNQGFVFGWPTVKAEDFIAEHNGVHESVGSIGSLAKGDFDVKFEFFYENGDAAQIPLLPLVIYDLDGGVETTATNDASNAVIPLQTGLSDCHGAATDGFAFCHEGEKDEVPTENMDWDHLTPAQKAASVTYVFKDKSEFVMRYKLGFEHRIFLFKGSKALVCKTTR